MDIRIGVQYSPKEIEVILPDDTDADSVRKHVEKAIESVARQTVRDLQVVVVDDASTDRSDEVIRRCLARLGDTRFRYVKLGAREGTAAGTRAGLPGDGLARLGLRGRS